MLDFISSWFYTSKTPPTYSTRPGSPHTPEEDRYEPLNKEIKKLYKSERSIVEYGPRERAQLETLTSRNVAKERECVSKARRMEMLMRTGVFLGGASTAFVIGTIANTPRRYLLVSAIFIGSGLAYMQYERSQQYVRDELLYSLPARGSILREALIKSVKQSHMKLDSLGDEPTFIPSPFTGLVAYFVGIFGGDKQKFLIARTIPHDSIDIARQYAILSKPVDDVRLESEKKERNMTDLLDLVSKYVNDIQSKKGDTQNVDLIESNGYLSQSEKERIHQHLKIVNDKVDNINHLL